MICVLDYGIGNVAAFVRIFQHHGLPVVRAQTVDDLYGAKRIILPGVGAFDRAMTKFNASGMREKVDDLVNRENVPLLGVCVGMQMLACQSEEGHLPGLGWISGNVRRIVVGSGARRLPHMGWNELRKIHPSPLMQDINPLQFYFLHSYIFEPNDYKCVDATFNYGTDFPCIISENNIFGVQFHPEKSLAAGEKLLINFASRLL